MFRCLNLSQLVDHEGYCLREMESLLPLKSWADQFVSFKESLVAIGVPLELVRLEEASHAFQDVPEVHFFPLFCSRFCGFLLKDFC